jgi:hypothetical protein
MSLQVAAISATVSPLSAQHRHPAGDTTPPYEELLTAICGRYVFSDDANAL